MRIGEHFTALPVRDSQQLEELLYDESGLPQGLYPQAAHKFAAAAVIEEALVHELVQTNYSDKAFFHHFSALSSWTQAGDLHRALLLGEMMLQTSMLSVAQREQVANYLQTLQQRMTQWMSQWTPELAAAD